MKIKKFKIDIKTSGIEIENDDEIILAIKTKLKEVFPKSEIKDNVISLDTYEEYLKTLDMITTAKIKLIALD